MKRTTLIAIVGFPFFLATVLTLLILAHEKGDEDGTNRDGPVPQSESESQELPRPQAISQPIRTTEPSGSVHSVVPLALLSGPVGNPIAEETAPENGGVFAALSYEALYDQALLLIRQHKEDEAVKLLIEMVESAPNDLRAYPLLGDLYYKKDRLVDAISVWERLARKDPGNPHTEALLVKARQEIKTHTSFTHETTRHFTIKFEGAENRHLYRTVLDSLEEAYGEVGRAFSFYPPEEVIVFLYTNQQFFDVTRAPAWSGGAFDGKIRIPALGYESQTRRLREVLFHEYIHSVIHRMTEQSDLRTGASVNVPTWLHEGIAQYFEPSDKTHEVNARLKAWVKQQGVVIDLSQLHGSFMGLNNVHAMVAYDESLSAVSFLINEFGTWRLKQLLEELPRRRSFDEAIQNVIFISYEQFQERWKATLQS